MAKTFDEVFGFTHKSGNPETIGAAIIHARLIELAKKYFVSKDELTKVSVKYPSDKPAADIEQALQDLSAARAYEGEAEAARQMWVEAVGLANAAGGYKFSEDINGYV